MRLQQLVLLVITCGCLIVIAGCGNGRSEAQSAHPSAHVGAVSLFAIAPRLERDGSPVPSVGVYPDGTASLIHYSMCAPGTSGCAPVRVVKSLPLPGPQPAGTLFKVTARYRGQAYSSGAKWRGNVRAVTRPTLAGHIQVGSNVVAAPARWTGGWPTDTNQLAVEACRTRATGDCVMLTGVWLDCTRIGCGIEGSVIGDHSSDNTVRIGYALSGWYVFTLNARIDPAADGLVGYSSPAALPVWKASPTLVRSAPYGPVAGPPGPQVQILPHAQVNGNHVIVTSVRCIINCRVWITVSRIGNHFASGQRIAWSANKVIKGLAMVGVWGSIPPGRMSVQINVGDGPYLHGHTHVG